MTLVLDAPRVLKQLTSGPVTVHRPATGAYVNGRWVPAGTDSVFVILYGSLQPLKPQELALLPEGYRTSESRKLFVDQQLYAADPVANTASDVVEIGSRTFRVFAVEPWNANGNFWKATLVKEGQ